MSSHFTELYKFPISQMISPLSSFPANSVWQCYFIAKNVRLHGKRIKKKKLNFYKARFVYQFKKLIQSFKFSPSKLQTRTAFELSKLHPSLLVTSCFWICSSVECLPPVKNVTLEEAKTLLKKRQNTIYNGEESPTVTEYYGPVLTKNQNFLSLQLSLKQKKKHLINFLHVPMTSDISEHQYSTMHYSWKNQ